MSSSSTSLTTSRIARLLRPLRMKCSHLATFLSSAPSIGNPLATTYSRRQTARLPIAVTDGRNAAQLLELQKKIGAVTECWRNVLHATYASEVTSTGRVASLSAMCASIVGETIQEEVQLNVKTADDTLNVEDDDEAAKIVEEMYDLVPPHYRRWTLAAHAVSIILETCPHHPALLTALLDLCISYRASHEATLVLRTLLNTLCAPPSNTHATPTLCHHTHISFLCDLRERWSSSSGAFYTSQYLAIVADALEDSSCSPEAWTSKAVRKFGRETRGRDFPGFVRHLAAGLVGALARLPLASRPVGRTENEMRARLMKWIDNIFDRLHSPDDPSRNNTDQSKIVEDFQAVVDFLIHCRTLGLHTCNTGAGEDELRVSGALTSLATYVVASPHFVRLGPEDHMQLVALLKDGQAAARTTSYNDLVLLLFPLNTATLKCDDDGDDAELDAAVQGGDSARSPSAIIRALRGHATALSAHGLDRLAASLWACALRHLERDWHVEALGGTVASSRVRVIEGMRDTMMKEVEEAEGRCFGPSSSSSSKSNKEGKGEWEWEELVQAWVRRSPEVRRTREREQYPLATPARRKGWEAATPCLSVKKSWNKRQRQLVFQAHTPRPTKSALALVEELSGEEKSDSDASEEDDDTDDDNDDDDGVANLEWSVPPKARGKTSPRASLPAPPMARLSMGAPVRAPLSVAPVNRHAGKRKRDASPDSFSFVRPRKEGRPASTRPEGPDLPAKPRRRDQNVIANMHTATGSRDAAATLYRGRDDEDEAGHMPAPSSDDALDMFNYPDSSPMKIRRVPPRAR